MEEGRKGGRRGGAGGEGRREEGRRCRGWGVAVYESREQFAREPTVAHALDGD